VNAIKTFIANHPTATLSVAMLVAGFILGKVI
jgi:hypothetical protein